MHDRTKSIEQLEQNAWNHNEFQSHVVQESQRLRRVPLQELEVEDLRLLITQSIGLQYTVPLALEVLAATPLIEAKYYPGDLLVAVLNVPDEYWSAHPQHNNSLVELGPDIQSTHQLLAIEVLPKLSAFHFK